MNSGPGRFGRWDLETGFIPACHYASMRGFVPRKKARPGLGALGGVQPGLAAAPTEQLLWGDSATSCWFQGRPTILVASTQMT